MVQVKVADGWLNGAELDVVTGEKRYFSFKGIPYAAPPIGKLRFKAPQPVIPWNGIRDATKHGATSPQIEIFENQYIPGDEDCLFLNVYSPNLSPKDPLPVMFFLHSGGYKSGSGNDDMYGPDFLMNHDVVLVTINYRLDIFGFLCLDTEDVPGNAGLKDQVAAMKWVQNNIKNFGGDPNNVTIFGDSAGGGSVTLHMLSPMSKGLFKRAIAMSGSVLSDWSTTFEPKRRAIKLAKTLGLDTTDGNELLEFYQNASEQNILSKWPQIMTSEMNMQFVAKLNPFAPVIEKNLGIDHFLTEDPLEILKKGKINEADFMIGYTSNECLSFLWYVEKTLSDHDNYRTEFVPIPVFNNTPPKKSLVLADKIVKHYFGDKKVNLSNINHFVDYNNDTTMRYPIHSYLRHLTKVNKSKKNYLYTFSCVTERNIFTKSGEKYGLSGASHIEDLWYLFYCYDPKVNVKVDISSKSYEYIQRSCKLFTDFAKYGNPTPDSSLGITWPEYDNEAMQGVDIGQELTIGTGVGREVLEFWDEIHASV